MVSNELASWYVDVKYNIGADVKDNVMTKNVGPSSQVLSGPQGSPSSTIVKKPWSGRLCGRESPASSSSVSHKGKEKVDDTLRMQNLSVGHDDVDGHSNGLDSLDEEFGIPSLKTPGVRRMQTGYRTPRSDPSVCRSRRVKNLV